MIISDRVLGDAHGYNEQSVRFYVIDEIIKALGYRDRPDTYCQLEEKLSYAYVYIGHKKPKRDVPLGFADYRVGIRDARGSCVIEAKAANVPLSNSDVEQGHSYAAHPEVGANYFVLCNGLVFEIYETLSGHNASPVVSLKLDEINERFHEIENVLSPDILRKRSSVEYDTGLKLCDGMPSSVKIRSGTYTLDSWSYQILVAGQDVTKQLRENVPQIQEMDRQFTMLQDDFVLRVSSGKIERDSDGRIRGQIKFEGVTVHNTKAMQLLGIETMTFITNDKFLSTDPAMTTQVEGEVGMALGKGSPVTDMFGAVSSMENDMAGELFIVGHVNVENQTLKGCYGAFSDYVYDVPGLGEWLIKLNLKGHVDFELAGD